jgi:hemerythrin-like metal-binding protein
MDTVARFGGDEFVVMISELQTGRAESSVKAGLIAEKIRMALSEPYLLTIRQAGRQEIPLVHHCTASIGLTLFLANEATQDEILKWADAAMYRAKESGRDAIEFAPAPVPADDQGQGVPANFLTLAWHSSYECGHALIDDQHRGLFGHANSLLGAVIAERPDDEIAALIDVLVRDVVQHFRDEESIFVSAGYPGAEEHTAIHRALVDRAINLVGRFHSETLSIGELFQFLALDVVARHMLETDRKFFPYLQDAGKLK